MKKIHWIISILIFIIICGTLCYADIKNPGVPSIAERWLGIKTFVNGLVVGDPNTATIDPNGKITGKELNLNSGKFTVDPNGDISSHADADGISTFNRAKIWGSGDTAYFSHYDFANTTLYAIKQTAGGDTYISCGGSGNAIFSHCGTALFYSMPDGIVMNPGKTITQDGLTTKAYAGLLADEASIALPSGISGWGEIQVGDDEEWCTVKFKSNGTITLRENTANVVTSDTDGKFVIYSNAGVITIKNRLGSSKNVAYKFEYRIIP